MSFLLNLTAEHSTSTVFVSNWSGRGVHWVFMRSSDVFNCSRVTTENGTRFDVEFVFLCPTQSPVGNCCMQIMFHESPIWTTSSRVRTRKEKKNIKREMKQWHNLVSVRFDSLRFLISFTSFATETTSVSFLFLRIYCDAGRRRWNMKSSVDWITMTLFIRCFRSSSISKQVSKYLNISSNVELNSRCPAVHVYGLSIRRQLHESEMMFLLPLQEYSARIPEEETTA